MSKIKELMQEANRAYYEGKPIMSDAEYDALERIHGMLLESDGGEISHHPRMYSLKKHYDKDGTPPLALEKCIKTPKLDGAAVALYYYNGRLELALTRGDGKKGRDITDKLKLLVPTVIGDGFSGQITGEVVADKELPNSRNYASGALNLKSIDEFNQRCREGLLTFVAYDCTGEFSTYQEKLHWLATELFATCDLPGLEMFPTDGVVYRLNSEKEFKSLGYTDKFPRGAFAFKTEKDAVETTLIDVVWQTGKSGKVTPVAILESVDIDGANVSRATLNNMAYIEGLNLEIGCRVRVIRSGEIIPKIIGRAD